MNIRILRQFITVAEEKNITKAAARIHIEQAPLSLAIKRLEKELGFDLLIRNSKGIKLTEAGLHFLGCAKDAVKTIDSGISASRHMSAGLLGRIRIGFVTSASYELLPRIIQVFRKKFPNVDLTLKQMTNEELIRNLASENLDFIFTRSSLELKELSFETLVNEEFVCAIHAHHKLAKNKSVHIKDLKDESFITLRPYLGGFYDQLMGLFTEANFKPKIVQEMPQLDAIIGVVGTGLGVGIIPATLKYLNIPNVKYLKLNGVNSTARIYLAWNKNNLNGASAKFLEIATMHKNCTDSYKE